MLARIALGFSPPAPALLALPALSAVAFGQIQFAPPVQVASSPGCTSLHTADLDGDGFVDVLYASPTTSEVGWLRSLGGQGLAPASPINTQALHAHTAIAGDVDGDGLLDVIASVVSPPAVVWCRGLGGGSFAPWQIVEQGLGSPRGVSAADLDGDGDLDLVTADEGAQEFLLHTGDGTGAFATTTLLSQRPGARSTAIADLDLDGDLDIVTCSEGPSALFREGSSFVLAHSSFGYIAGPVVVKVGHLSGGAGGRPSLYFADPAAAAVVVVPPLGSSDYLPFSILMPAPGATDLLIEDLNGDGDEDLTVSCQTSNRVRYRERLPFGQLGPGGLAGLVDLPSAVCSIDLGQDQDADLVVATSSGIALLENLGPVDCNGNGSSDLDDIALGTAEDCDGDHVPDTCQFGAAPTLDWNGDGYHDACTPIQYCDGGINSTGQHGLLTVLGSPVLADQDFRLQASDLPANEWSFFLMSRVQGQVPGFGGSQGVLCLGAPILRLDRTSLGEIAQTTNWGTRTLSLDPTALPQGQAVQPGESWNFQLWFRDQNPGPTSNTTEAVQVLFR